MRLHQPVGILLLFWPCAWAIMLAGGDLPLILLFLAGSVVMRAAGCIINDLTDRKLDSQIERTRSRPLASGELSEIQAILLLVLLLCIGLAIALMLPPVVIKLAVAVMPLIILYPWMKRITWWPQLFLGLTFNWGALMGWAAVRGEIELPAVMLYIAGIFWTLGYDTIYAHQDKRDDIKAGIKSTALKLGRYSKLFIALFYIAMIAVLMSIGAWLHPPLHYYLFTGVMGVMLLAQVAYVRLDDAASCFSAFASNAWGGGIYFAACLVASHGGDFQAF